MNGQIAGHAGGSFDLVVQLGRQEGIEGEVLPLSASDQEVDQLSRQTALDDTKNRPIDGSRRKILLHGGAQGRRRLEHSAGNGVQRFVPGNDVNMSLSEELAREHGLAIARRLQQKVRERLAPAHVVDLPTHVFAARATAGTHLLPGCAAEEGSNSTARRNVGLATLWRAMPSSSTRIPS